jgi:cytochrome c556
MINGNSRNNRWITKDNVIITLLLAILLALGNITIKVTRLEQSFSNHDAWDLYETERIKTRMGKIERGEHPATANRFTRQDATIMDNKIKDWTRKNFVMK